MKRKVRKKIVRLSGRTETIPEDVIERLYSQTIRVGTCLIWTGRRNARWDLGKYGVIGWSPFPYSNLTMTTHALAARIEILDGGPLASDVEVHHLCPETFCINADHLLILPIGLHKAMHLRGRVYPRSARSVWDYEAGHARVIYDWGR